MGHEDGFDDDGAADDGGEGRAKVGDHGNETAAQAMADDDGGFLQSLGPRGAREILVEDLDHPGAGQPADVRQPC